MNRRRKSCYRPYEGKRRPLWRKAVLALLLAGALAVYDEQKALEEEIAALYTKWETLAAELEEARG